MLYNRYYTIKKEKRKMEVTQEYYELSIYNPINDHTYRVTRKIFDSHEKGMRWAIDNYGWTDALYTGDYVNGRASRNIGFIYLSKDEVDMIGAQSVSDLRVLMQELKGIY